MKRWITSPLQLRITSPLQTKQNIIEELLDYLERSHFLAVSYFLIQYSFQSHTVILHLTYTHYLLFLLTERDLHMARGNILSVVCSCYLLG